MKNDDFIEKPIKQINKGRVMLTIVIPIYNQADFLDEALNGISNQIDTNFRLVISDNCSTDHIDEIINKYRYKLKIDYRKESIFLSKALNWNRVMKYSLTKYTMLHHSDDIISPTCVRDLNKYIKMFPKISLFHGNFQRMHVSSDNLLRQKRMFPFEYVQKNDSNILDYVCSVSIVGQIFSTDKFNEIGGFDNTFQQAHDWDFFIKLLGVCDYMYIRKNLGYVRMGNSTAKIDHIANLEILRILKRNKKFLAKTNLKRFAFGVYKFYEKNSIYKDEFDKELGIYKITTNNRFFINLKKNYYQYIISLYINLKKLQFVLFN